VISTHALAGLGMYAFFLSTGGVSLQPQQKMPEKSRHLLF